MVAGYIDKGHSDVVKGIFIILVFISHFQGYVSNAGGWTANLFLGQLMVAMFFFYSGFGVKESISHKENYLSKIPTRRILTTLLNFDVAVLAYVALNLLLGVPMCKAQLMSAFIGWDSVGNSNWYVFVILLCYVIAYISRGKLLLMTGLMIAAMVVLSFYKPAFWYDTFLCFAAGGVFSRYKTTIERIGEKYYWWCIMALLVLFVALSMSPIGVRGLVRNFRAVAFCLVVVALTMKFNLKSPYLEWLGRNLFPLYIYQRIPMIIVDHFDHAGLATGRAFVWLGICFGTTVMIALAYPRWRIKLNEVRR